MAQHWFTQAFLLCLQLGYWHQGLEYRTLKYKFIIDIYIYIDDIYHYILLCTLKTYQIECKDQVNIFLLNYYTQSRCKERQYLQVCVWCCVLCDNILSLYTVQIWVTGDIFHKKYICRMDICNVKPLNESRNENLW